MPAAEPPHLPSRLPAGRDRQPGIGRGLGHGRRRRRAPSWSSAGSSASRSTTRSQQPSSAGDEAISSVERPARTPRSRSAMVCSVTESTAVVGSCSTSTGASVASARASATRWRWPPESRLPFSPTGTSRSAAKSSHAAASHRGVQPVGCAGRGGEVVADRAGEQRGPVRRDGDPGAVLGRGQLVAPEPVEPHLDVAAGRSGRGFSSASAMRAAVRSSARTPTSSPGSTRIVAPGPQTSRHDTSSAGSAGDARRRVDRSSGPGVDARGVAEHVEDACGRGAGAGEVGDGERSRSPGSAAAAPG